MDTDGSAKDPTTSERNPAPTMLLHFLEAHPDARHDVTCATQTMTKTLEETDQDQSILAGTQTRTATIENSDQDPHLFGTQTATFTSEEGDQDQDRTYFAIPRA